MNTFYKHLTAEEEKLQKQVGYLKSKRGEYPEGILEISYCRGHVQYYQRAGSGDKGREKRLYIRKKDRAFAKALAQRDYDRKLLAELEKRLYTVTQAREAYEKTAPEKVIKRFTMERRELIDPLIPSDERFVKNWLAEEYEGKPFAEGTPEIITARGERVRSKSEKIIADTLDRYDIPYKYECPLTLLSGITVYPDFRVLNTEQRKEFIWEHLGMMDNETYAANAVNKINSYIKNGIVPGDGLIITMETSQAQLGTRAIETMIGIYLK